MKKIILMLVLVLLSACSVNPKEEEGISIVTTFFPTWSYAQMLAPHAKIVNIVGEGEAHGYEPSPRDIEKIQKADIFIYNGAGFESWVDTVLGSLDQTKTKVVNASENVPLIQEEGRSNPHTWMNPQNAVIQMESLLNALIEVDSTNQVEYQKNFETNQVKLYAIDQAYDQFLSTVTHKEIVVDHDAYTYLLEPYGIKQKTIIGGIFDEEPTAKAIENTIDYIKSERIQSIYIEEFSNDKVAKLIQSETGAKLYTLHTLESVSKKDIDEGASLISLFEQNLQVLKEGMK